MKAIYKDVLLLENDLLIRPMKEEDLDEVVSLEEKCFSEPWSKKSFLETLESDDALFICVFLDKELVGYCGTYNGYGDGDILNVAIKEENRGRGYAKVMLQKLMELGRQMGIVNYTLEVRISNQNAIALYEKLGFESVGVRPGFYEKPKEDALIMWNYGK